MYLQVDKMKMFQWALDLLILFRMNAVKVLDWGQEGQETKHREAFEKEVAVWQKLDHPNVTKVLYLWLNITLLAG